MKTNVLLFAVLLAIPCFAQSSLEGNRSFGGDFTCSPTYGAIVCTVSKINGTAFGLPVSAGNGGTGIANTATLTLGTTNQNWATLGTGIVKNTTTTGALSVAVSGDFPTLNQSTTGNAATATALASTPTLCSSGQAPTGILASGNATGCATLSGAVSSVSNADGTLTISPTTGSVVASIANNAAIPGSPTTTTQASTDSSTKVATTSFVQTVVNNAIAAVNPAVAVEAATITILPNSPIYNNGVSGIGATITTATTNTALVIDGYTPVLNDRVLVKDESGGLGASRNGVYLVTQVSGVGLAWILTRALDYDQPSDMNNTGAIPVVSGTVNLDTSWVLTSNVVTVGTSAVTFTKFSINPTTIQTNTLTNTHLWIGNGSNVATDVALSGDGTLANTGAITITKLNSTTPGGTCTNQAVTSLSSSAVPACTTLTSAYVNNSIALTGTDINTSNQVTATHLAAALPIAQGGTAGTTASTGFNNLSPMTTVGDVIIGGTSGAGTRLGIGSTNQVLTVVGGSPAWAAAGGVSSAFPLTVSGTVVSGGIPGFTSTTTETSSALLPTGALVLGGGAGATPTANAALAANSSGQFTAVNGLTTSGNGVPIVVAVSDLTGQAAAQSGTAINLIGSGKPITTTSAAMYSIDFYADTAAVCSTPGPGAVTFQFNWTDATSARQFTTGSLVYSTSQSTTTGQVFGTIKLWAASGGTITYTPTFTACTTGTGTWDVHARVIQL